MFLNRQLRRVLILLTAFIVAVLVKTSVYNKEIQNLTMVNGDLIMAASSPLLGESATQQEEEEEEEEMDDYGGEYRFESYCSWGADSRGPHQKVIAYSLYGDFTDSTIFTRYVEPLKMILQNITKVYPGINLVPYVKMIVVFIGPQLQIGL